MITIVLALALALPLPAQAKPTQSSKKPAPTATLELKVTDRTGEPLAGAEVRVDGPSSREGRTNADGLIVFRNMNAGSYRARAERDGFVTLEKELTLKAGAPHLVEAALSPAPAASAAPPPPKTEKPEPSPVLAAGLARALAVNDELVRTRLPGKEPVERLSVGCSGAMASELLRLRDGLESHTHADADEVLYVVAGEATLTLGSQDLKIGPGWYSLVPRGTPHALVRQGRNPIILLSVLSGPPCPASELKE
jgi:mannose-6-phosphate isomerase-like protein (cupin superfamily)